MKWNGVVRLPWPNQNGGSIGPRTWTITPRKYEQRNRVYGQLFCVAAIQSHGCLSWVRLGPVGHVGSTSGLPETGQGRAIYGRYGDARLAAAWFCDKRTCHQTAVAGKFDCRER